MIDATTRRATAADADALAALDGACFTLCWDAHNIRSLMADELTVAWRRDSGSRLVAAVLVRCVAGEGEVLRIAVHPEHRGQGHARALMSAVIEELSPLLTHGLHLEVRASNAPARGLYRSLGFDEVGSRRSYYVAPVEDAVLMCWPGVTRGSAVALHGR